MVAKDSDYFLELQTQTGWGRTLHGFAIWCAPQPGWLTLDVGCGPGLLPAIFSQMGCRAVGIDLDIGMFRPSPLHPGVAVADVHALPFVPKSFDLVTASNLIFMLPEPVEVMIGLKPLLRPGGKLAMLNPSEHLDHDTAVEFADKQGMQGIARQTLLRWAGRAQEHHHWTEDETRLLYTDAGFDYRGCVLKVGPGFGRFSSGIA